MQIITEDQKNKIIAFLKKNKLVAISVTAFAVIAIVTLLLSQSGGQNRQEQKGVAPTTALEQNPSGPTNPPPSIESGQPDAATFEKTWEESASYVFSEDYLKGFAFEKKQLADGSTTYTYASDNPKRPDMLMVKNGEVILKRMIVVDMTVDNYVLGQGKPDYIARGSRFWGPEAVTYIYFKMGLAFVADPKTNTVFEDLSFKPVSPRDYKRVYGEDIIGELSKP